MSTTTPDCTRCDRPAEAHAGTDRLSLATRTMKARRSSVCTICHAPVLVGQTIAKLVSPAAWVHVRCVPVVARVTSGVQTLATRTSTR